MIKLSVLIPTLPAREEMFESLMMELNRQSIGRDIEILYHPDPNMTIGEKRNQLVDLAVGDYICFIDDDDEIPPYYINEILAAIRNRPDCCSLVGEITIDGRWPKLFIHSLDFDSYFEKDGIYYRPPNHLNVIKTSIARRFKFPLNNFGEDTDWAMQICKAGVLKREEKINKVMYYYKYRTKK